jgi:hypothetical protein
MTPTKRKGTFKSGVAPDEGSGELGEGEASADFVGGADGVAGAKLIFKGGCAVGGMCAEVAGEGFNFSGKFGRAGAETSGANVNSLGALGVWVVETGLVGSE